MDSDVHYLNTFCCECCDYLTNKKSSFDNHLLSRKHLANLDESKCTAKHECQLCNYSTSRKSSYDKHISTDKHLEAVQYATQCGIIFACQFCAKSYTTKAGLWKHQKSCQTIKPFTDAEIIGLLKQSMNQNDSLTGALVQQNSALVQQNGALVQVLQNGTTNHSHNTTTQTHTNSHNSFNLHFYLNETCKDAMNLSDFVNSVQMDLADLEETGRKGYVDGITNIIQKNLRRTGVHMRPLHCCDSKREVLYVKENNVWTKEEDGKPMLTKAIKTIANANIKQIQEWKKLHPNCDKSDHKKNNQYLNIVSNSMSGGTVQECNDNYNKIVKNIVKSCVIDKHK